MSRIQQGMAGRSIAWGPNVPNQRRGAVVYWVVVKKTPIGLRTVLTTPPDLDLYQLQTLVECAGAAALWIAEQEAQQLVELAELERMWELDVAAPEQEVFREEWNECENDSLE